MIYLDHAATTPVLPEVAEEVRRGLTDCFGNPSSLHAAGVAAKRAVAEARERIAAALRCAPGEILFTAGGTEADNLAVIGYARANRKRGAHIVISTIEHHAVLHAAEVLEKEGFEVSRVPVGPDGIVRLDALERALRPDTLLVSVMHSNNEVGTVQPVGEIARLTRPRGIAFHADYVQSLGKIPVDLVTPGLDLASFAAHKIYGPKGVGALFARKGIALEPMLVGGSHESGRRAGTENVPGILGFAKAVEIAVGDLARETERQRKLRDRLQAALAGAIDPMRVNGHPERRLPNHLSVCFPGVEAEGVILHLSSEGIAVSSGSACTSASQEPSHVLSAMGIPADIARGTIRYTLGRTTREEDLPAVVSATARAVEKLRALNPMWPVEA